MFNKINDTQFSFNNEIFTVANNVTIYKATGVISLDKYTPENGLLNTSFTGSEFKNFISSHYNGDENITDWLK